MTTLENAYESINKEIIELLSNIDVIMNNRFETYFSECFTKFLDLNRE